MELQDKLTEAENDTEFDDVDLGDLSSLDLGDEVLDERGRPSRGVIFFIDRERFFSKERELTVRQLLVGFAHEDPTQTTLVQKRRGELIKYTNLDEIIHLRNGMRFVVFHNTPTPVS